jgi:hypothetical protein
VRIILTRVFTILFSIFLVLWNALWEIFPPSTLWEKWFLVINTTQIDSFLLHWNCWWAIEPFNGNYGN